MFVIAATAAAVAITGVVRRWHPAVRIGTYLALGAVAVAAILVVP
jgi:hypothetical protein